MALNLEDFLRKTEENRLKSQADFLSIIRKYDRPFDDVDEIDLKTLEIVTDKGEIKRKKYLPKVIGKTLPTRRISTTPVSNDVTDCTFINESKADVSILEVVYKDCDLCEDPSDGESILSCSSESSEEDSEGSEFNNLEECSLTVDTDDHDERTGECFRDKTNKDGHASTHGPSAAAIQPGLSRSGPTSESTSTENIFSSFTEEKGDGKSVPVCASHKEIEEANLDQVSDLNTEEIQTYKHKKNSSLFVNTTYTLPRIIKSEPVTSISEEEKHLKSQSVEKNSFFKSNVSSEDMNAAKAETTTSDCDVEILSMKSVEIDFIVVDDDDDDDDDFSEKIQANTERHISPVSVPNVKTELSSEFEHEKSSQIAEHHMESLLPTVDIKVIKTECSSIRGGKSNHVEDNANIHNVLSSSGKCRKVKLFQTYKKIKTASLDTDKTCLGPNKEPLESIEKSKPEMGFKISPENSKHMSGFDTGENKPDFMDTPQHNISNSIYNDKEFLVNKFLESVHDKSNCDDSFDLENESMVTHNGKKSFDNSDDFLADCEDNSISSNYEVEDYESCAEMDLHENWNCSKQNEKKDKINKKIHSGYTPVQVLRKHNLLKGKKKSNDAYSKWKNKACNGLKNRNYSEPNSELVDICHESCKPYLCDQCGKLQNINQKTSQTNTLKCNLCVCNVNVGNLIQHKYKCEDRENVCIKQICEKSSNQTNVLCSSSNPISKSPRRVCLTPLSPGNNLPNPGRKYEYVPYDTSKSSVTAVKNSQSQIESKVTSRKLKPFHDSGSLQPTAGSCSEQSNNCEENVEFDQPRGAELDKCVTDKKMINFSSMKTKMLQDVKLKIPRAVPGDGVKIGLVASTPNKYAKSICSNFVDLDISHVPTLSNGLQKSDNYICKPESQQIVSIENKDIQAHDGLVSNIIAPLPGITKISSVNSYSDCSCVKLHDKKSPLKVRSSVNNEVREKHPHEKFTSEKTESNLKIATIIIKPENCRKMENPKSISTTDDPKMVTGNSKKIKEVISDKSRNNLMHEKYKKHCQPTEFTKKVNARRENIPDKIQLLKGNKKCTGKRSEAPFKNSSSSVVHSNKGFVESILSEQRLLSDANCDKRVQHFRDKKSRLSDLTTGKQKVTDATKVETFRRGDLIHHHATNSDGRLGKSNKLPHKRNFSELSSSSFDEKHENHNNKRKRTNVEKSKTESVVEISSEELEQSMCFGQHNCTKAFCFSCDK